MTKLFALLLAFFVLIPTPSVNADAVWTIPKLGVFDCNPSAKKYKVRLASERDNCEISVNGSKIPQVFTYGDVFNVNFVDYSVTDYIVTNKEDAKRIYLKNRLTHFGFVLPLGDDMWYYVGSKL